MAMGIDDVSMWSYWSSKYGIKSALETYFPDLLKTDAEVAAALTQIKTAEAFIELRMQKLTEEANVGADVE